MCKTLQVCYAHRNSTITLFIVKLHQEIMEVITAVLQTLMSLSRGLLCIRVKALLIKSLKLVIPARVMKRKLSLQQTRRRNKGEA